MEPAISLASLATFSILFSVVRPTLPYWGYVWCRFSDFLAISIVLFSLLMHPKFRKDALNDSTVVSMSFWTILYILVILISIFSNALLFDFSLKNLVEITRPIILCSCFLFGYFYVDEKRLSFNFFLKTLVAIAFLNVTVGVLQLLLPDPYKYCFYYPYVGNNLYCHGRAGGISYNHIEYTTLSALGALSSIFLFHKTNLIRYLVAAFIILPLSLLSLSKTSLLLVGSLTLVISVYFFKQHSSVKMKIAILLMACLLFSTASIIVLKSEYLYNGVVSLFDSRTILLTNFRGSIGERLKDIAIVFQNIFLGDYHYAFFIGFSSLRANALSEIEISLINLLFRFGLIGFFLYYAFILRPFFSWIRFRKKAHFSFLSLLGALSFIIFLMDFTTNCSESIKFSVLYAIFIGASERYFKTKTVQF